MVRAGGRAPARSPPGASTSPWPSSPIHHWSDAVAGLPRWCRVARRVVVLHLRPRRALDLLAVQRLRPRGERARGLHRSIPPRPWPRSSAPSGIEPVLVPADCSRRVQLGLLAAARGVPRSRGARLHLGPRPARRRPGGRAHGPAAVRPRRRDLGGAPRAPAARQDTFDGGLRSSSGIDSGCMGRRGSTVGPARVWSNVGRSHDGSRCMDVQDIDLTDLDRFAGGLSRRRLHRPAAPGAGVVAPPTSHTPDGVGFWVVSRHAHVHGDGSDAQTLLFGRCPGPARGRHPDRGPALRVRRRGAAQHDGRPPSSPDPSPGDPGGGAPGPCPAGRRAAGPDGRHPRRGGRRGADATSSWTWPSSCPCRPRPCSWASPTRTVTTSWPGRAPASPTTTASSGARARRCRKPSAAMAAYGTALLERKRRRGR